MASPIVLMLMVLCGIAYGSDDNGFVVVPSSSLEPDETAVCSNATATVNLEQMQNHSRVWLPLAHRHGPCAPWKITGSSSGSSRPSSLAEALRRNRARSSHITSREEDGEKVVIPAHLDSSVDSLEYVVTVGFGTPAVQQTVLIDTGSGLSWIQCNSSHSHKADPSLFDPSHSSTYNPVPCGSSACTELGGYGVGCTNNGTGHGQCRFGILYADGTTTGGVYSRDRLTLTHVDTVDNFRFGCGLHRSSSSEKKKKNKNYDGLLALGRSPTSLVSQTSSSSVYRGAAFSYCLPAVNSRSGFLALGVRRSSTAGFAFTPLLTSTSTSTFYEVAMTGIAVGGERLDLQPSAFAGGMRIDSGKVVTSLQSTAYGSLRAAVRKAMHAYPLLPQGPLDTCFNLTGYRNVAVPKVALTFSGGATVDLDVPGGVLVEGCLAFEDAGADGSLGVLGNVNQRNFEVLFDTGRSKVGFRANAC